MIAPLWPLCDLSLGIALSQQHDEVCSSQRLDVRRRRKQLASLLRIHSFALWVIVFRKAEITSNE